MNDAAFPRRSSMRGASAPYIAAASPADYVEAIFDREMDVTLGNFLKGSPRDEAMKRLTQEAVNLYTKRVLRELIQNAFDGAGGNRAKIFVRLDLSEEKGLLQVANTGRGFTESNVDAVSSPAMSNKTPGNYIGHKGLGFRSVELLSDQVEIHSMCGLGHERASGFDGFRFRFASEADQTRWLESHGRGSLASDLVGRVHRLQLPVPITDRREEIDAHAAAGYATLIHLPLRDAIAANAASAEIDLLIDNAAPISLFLRGLDELRIQRITSAGRVEVTTLKREAHLVDLDLGVHGSAVEEVTAEGRRYLIARMPVDDPAFRASVADAVSQRYKVEQWAEWEGTPEVSIALRLTGDANEGVVYAFLPMDRSAPFNGYVDAPFHPDADRKDIDTANPLNRFLLGQVAELCIRLVQAIERVPRPSPEWQAAAVDAIAWTAEVELIEEACGRLQMTAGELPVPVMRREETGERWSRLDQVLDWRDESFGLLRRTLAVKVCGIPILPAALGEARIACLARFAKAVGFTLDADWASWREWAPQFAAHLAKKRKLVRGDWEQFYADLAHMPAALEHLHGTAIFRLEDGTLAEANDLRHEGERELFIASSAEGETVRNRRRLGSASTPPNTVTKRMLIADQGLTWPPAVASALTRAGLATRYDLPRVLSRLRVLLGPKPRYASVVAALGWAFAAWRDHRSPEVEDAIKGAGLAVPVARGGTRPASQAYFGPGWRDTRGNMLAEFLALVPDDLSSVRFMRDGLLPDWEGWPLSDRGTATDWAQFLRLLGVRDGPVVQHHRAVTRSIGAWVSMRSSDEATIPHEVALGPWWRMAIRTDRPWSGFRYQSGSYSTGETLYVIPAQAAQPTMSDDAKQAFASLLVAFLAELKSDRLRTTLSRTEGNPDVVSVPSPVAAFLRLSKWLPVVGGEGPEWRRPDQCWYAPRGEPMPRFIPRIMRAARDGLDSSKAARELLVGSLGLKLWNDPASGPQRIAELGRCAADGIAEADLDAFRKAHREAWSDWHALEPRPDLPAGLTLVVDRGGRPQALADAVAGDKDVPVVYIGDGSDTAREQLICGLGHHLLTVPPGTAPDVAQALSRARGGTFVLLDDARLTIRGDAQIIEPGPDHPAIAGDGREWLAEIAVLVLELNDTLSSRNTARSRQALYDAFMRLRVAFSAKTTVELGGTQGPLPSALDGVLALPDQDCPTILVEGASHLDWPVLSRMARSFAAALGKPSLDLAFRLTFLQLDTRLADGTAALARPTDDQIAEALGHPTSRIREVKRSLRSSNRSLFELLIPMVRVLAGGDAATRLREREHALVEDHDIETLLAGAGMPLVEVRRLLAAARSADSLDGLRRDFAIPFVMLNQALSELGAPWEPLDLSGRLHRQFDKWLGANRSRLEERVRDRFLRDFDEGRDLADYNQSRDLSWATFQNSWSPLYDDLPDEVVEVTIEAALAKMGQDAGGAPALPLEEVRNHNRAVLLTNLDEIVRTTSAWAAKNSSRSNSSELVQPAEQITRLALAAGVLDFRPLNASDLPAALRRAGLWPAEMEPTLDLERLGLTKADLTARAEAEERTRQERLRERRTITFGATEVDGGAPGSFQSVSEALEAGLSSKAFQKRSGEAHLLPLPATGGGGGKGSKRKGSSREPEYASEEQRTLLGFAGELAAYRYLQRNVRAFSDNYWISSMGRRFLGLPAMDDSDGYDFHVRRSKGPDLYFEVKAHTGDPGFVDLERSQVEAALSFADETRGIWRILYVTHVKDPDLISVHELCNPFGEAGRRLFRQRGREAVRLEMRRSDEKQA